MQGKDANKRCFIRAPQYRVHTWYTKLPCRNIKENIISAHMKNKTTERKDYENEIVEWQRTAEKIRA